MLQIHLNLHLANELINCVTLFYLRFLYFFHSTYETSYYLFYQENFSKFSFSKLFKYDKIVHCNFYLTRWFFSIERGKGFLVLTLNGSIWTLWLGFRSNFLLLNFFYKKRRNMRLRIFGFLMQNIRILSRFMQKNRRSKVYNQVRCLFMAMKVL